LLNKDFNKLSDEELIKEFQENNTLEAYETLVRRYKDSLINFVYRFVGDKEAAIDIVQDTMLKFYLKKDSYQTIAKFSTWLYTIAANLAKNEIKRRKRRSILSLNNSKEDDAFEIQVADINVVEPDRAAHNEIMASDIQKALLKVNPVYRELVILRDIEGFSYEEIAEMKGLQLGTVKSRINRGRNQLKKLLQKYVD
jgi:RNA polymerase sigma-70 factor (ECF subfamily)